MNCSQQKYGLILIYLFSMGFIAAIFFLHTASAESIQLIPLKNIEIERERIYLSDLVHIKGAKQEFKERLSKVEMGMTPPLGRSRTIEKNDIRLRLKRAQIDPKQIEILIPQPITVTRASLSVSPELIRKEVKTFIKNQISLKDTSVTIKNIRWPGQLSLPSGKFAFKIQSKYPADYIGNVNLTMLFYVNNRLEKQLPVSADVEVVTKIVFTRNPLSRGQIIQASDLELRSTKLSKIKGHPIKNLDFVIGKRARYKIYPQQVIDENDIEIPPTLRRGDTVKIIVAFSSLIATAQGVVRENGKVGDKIKVVNIDSKKTLYATIVDSHTVKVEF
ncbi:MAG: flagellar basal body P-ring formation chaperone FlgA [Desulfobacteraceae bacterium]|jgi:flagella basal body P-ring formation protein FlgA